MPIWLMIKRRFLHAFFALTFSSGTAEVTNLSFPPQGFCGSGGFSYINPGDYIEVSSANLVVTYRPWYKISGTGTAPSGNPVEVDISFCDSSDTVAFATKSSLDSISGTPFVPGASFNPVTLTNSSAGAVPDANSGTISPSQLVIIVATQGTDSDINLTTDTLSVLAHGFPNFVIIAVSLTTTGTLPAPLVVGTKYYPIYVDADHIKLASSVANAQANVAIDLTSNGSGVHTVTRLH